MSARLLRLDVRCPACGKPPKLRAFEDAEELFESVDREHAVMTYECHVKTCGERYIIRVRHLTDAA